MSRACEGCWPDGASGVNTAVAGDYCHGKGGSVTSGSEDIGGSDRRVVTVRIAR